MSSDGTDRFWDHEDCPRDDCDGELQQQDRHNVMCLGCKAVFTHYRYGDRHWLGNEDFETVAEKKIATDGGTDSGCTERWCDGCEDETPHRQIAPSSAPGPTYECLVCPERIEIEGVLRS